MHPLDEIPDVFDKLKSDAGLHVDDVRSGLRERAIKSTYFMAKAVIGFKDMTRGTHGPMCRVMEDASKRKLVVIPRDHLKTSVCTIADSTRRIAADPNIRILLGNETATNSSHFLRRIEAIFDNCARFRWLFPDLIEEPNKRSKWSESEMLVPRTIDNPEATIEAIGVGGAVVSRHYDVIKLDDLVGKEASESMEVMRKTIDWYIYTESLLVHPTESEIHVVGTRWAYHDVIQHILETESESFEKLLLSAEQPPDGLWPERFPLSVLANIRKKMGSWKYSCQYLNAPHDPEASSFDPAWLHYFTIDGDNCRYESFLSPIKDMRRFLLVDPAIKQDDQACNTSMVVVGYDRLGRKWVLETYVARIQPREIITRSFDLYNTWDCECLGIETIAFQKVLKYFMQEEMEKKGTYVNVTELKPDNRKSKMARIRSLQPFFERGELFFQRNQKELIHEYEAFPTGMLVDTLDALSYAPQVWGPPSEDSDDEAEEEVFFQKGEYEGMSSITGY